MMNEWEDSIVVAAVANDRITIKIFATSETDFIYIWAKSELNRLHPVSLDYEFYEKERVKGGYSIFSFRPLGWCAFEQGTGHAAVFFYGVHTAIKEWKTNPITRKYPEEKLMGAIQDWKMSRLHVSGPRTQSVLEHLIE